MKKGDTFLSWQLRVCGRFLLLYNLMLGYEVVLVDTFYFDSLSFETVRSQLTYFRYILTFIIIYIILFF